MKEAPRFNLLIHDMRNRLAVARANVEAFIDGKIKPDAVRLRAVLQSLGQLEELLNELAASKSAAEAQAQPVEVDVREILARECRAVEAVATQKGISLSVVDASVKSSERSHFVGDPVRIARIVANVIRNAVRYAAPGSAIRFECARRADRLEISIADSTAASGLGLIVTKEFVEAEGGSIDAVDSNDSSARFVLCLPGAVFSNEGKSAS